MLVCKRWYTIATHPLIWKQLYKRQQWKINYERIWRCEEWAEQETQRLRDWIAQHPQQCSLEQILEQILPMDSMFRPPHIMFLSGTELVLNWRFLYLQRYRLLKNWEKGAYICYTVPRTLTLGYDEMHQDGIYCIEFDRNWIVSGSKDTTIRIWDLQKGLCHKVFRGHRASVLTLQFDVNMNVLVSGSSDTLVIIWNLSSGKILSIYKGHTDSVLSLCFDTKHIVTCSKDSTIRIWHHVGHVIGEKRHYIHVLRGHHAAVNAVQLKEDRIVSASGDRTIRIWNVYTGTCLRTIMCHQRGVACLQFDGKHIVSGSSDHLVRLFDADSGQVLHTFEGHLDLVRTVRYHSDKIISGSYDENICIWDLFSGKLLHQIKSKDAGRIYRIAFDDIRIVSCGQKKHIIVYDFGHDIDTTFF
ncbi:hypothetical protein PMAC_000359 [Pneumocystis sp. 'macacae']|nr:hypothetical protein PMAC_000359 [Pneumocystis sp. 'macacae']